MTYSCSDFTDTILDALNIRVPDESLDSPSDQADLCLDVIARMERIEKAARGVVAVMKTPESYAMETALTALRQAVEGKP